MLTVNICHKTIINAFMFILRHLSECDGEIVKYEKESTVTLSTTLFH